MSLIKPLDIKSKAFCWKQCTYSTARMKPRLLRRVMDRCIYKLNHSGKHSWEYDEDSPHSQTQTT